MPGINLQSRGTLVRLSETENELPSGGFDYTGKDVVDKNNQEIGTVKDVFVDEKEQRPRFLEVSSGGFLGIGATTFLIPVDAVSGTAEDNIRINQDRSRFTSHPKYNPVKTDERFLTDTYAFYGTTPYWSPGYRYPTFHSPAR